jgi:hypothetical protein
MAQAVFGHRKAMQQQFCTAQPAAHPTTASIEGWTTEAQEEEASKAEEEAQKREGQPGSLA